jgi:hypothetical protein
MVMSASLMNNFTGGLKTEFTGLNFPENAATDTQNVVFSIIGEALRREGIDLEVNAVQNSIFVQGKAVNTYKWTNVGGDGQTQVLVVQIGNTLYFFTTSSATPSLPVSAQLLGSTVMVSTYQASGNTSAVDQTECQFTDGNGYLFVFHPDCDTFYCTYNAGTVTANKITIQIRDFAGLNDGYAVGFRPPVLTNEHQYNLLNQGWTAGNGWFASSTSNIPLTVGSKSFSVASGITGISNGQLVALSPNIGGGGSEGGTVTGYTGSTLTINITSAPGVGSSNNWSIAETSAGFLTTWNTAEGNYPSNSDIWYEYKDTTNQFNPATTAQYVSVGFGQSPQGHYLLNAFNQDRSSVSGVPSLTPVTTNVRPKCGTWFQGRVWYAGVDASQQATGDAIYQTWTENIYFSQIVQAPTDFGSCYEINDPTDETLNTLLPTDGGVIVIQGCGSIYNLFPIQNGVLVFAANGIWIIRGNQGLGFTANDYSINKISAVQSISTTSLVNVNGLPMFWNEEGIYSVTPSKEQAPYGFGGMEVEPLTVGTILSYYNQIPRDSKRFVRGDYNPITYVVQWCFRSTQESGISNRYEFDTILNLNIYNKAFYPYVVGQDNVYFISDVIYMSYPSGTLDPTFKYFATDGTRLSFAEERDDVTWLDWFSVDNVGVNYVSYFVTGYHLGGKGLKRWSSNYIQMFCDNSVPYAYTIQGIWDYAGSGNSGRWTTIQTITNYDPNYRIKYRRHKLRGHGMSLQIKVSSVQGQPFTVQGWSSFEDVRQGP